MKRQDLFRIAAGGVSANVSRSLLTMLGIIIGVGSVVLMTGVGKSMEGLILSQISTLGSKTMVIFPGKGPEQGVSSARTGFDSLTFRDLDALRNLNTISSLAPAINVSGGAQYGRETTTPLITGTTPEFFQNQSIEMERGRSLTDDDVENARFVAILGPDAAIDLFLNDDPLDKRITIGGRSFTVVGIFAPVGTQFFQNFDDRILIPLSAAEAVTGQRYLDAITMQAVSDFDLAFADVKSLLRTRHAIVNPEDDPDEDDFIVRSSAQAQEILSTVSLGLTLFITILAGISLVVGGIGIMNMMLVTVTERTREIGLRKALGAKKRDITIQFLSESILLTLAGGIAGIVCGIGIAVLIALVVGKFFDTYQFAVSWGALLLALIMAAGTGTIFGIYPAIQAAKVSPIEALRYE